MKYARFLNSKFKGQHLLATVPDTSRGGVIEVYALEDNKDIIGLLHNGDPTISSVNVCYGHKIQEKLNDYLLALKRGEISKPTTTPTRVKLIERVKLNV